MNSTTLAPRSRRKKNGRHIWPNYDIKNFFQKKFKCTPCPKYWTVTSTLMTFEHSRKQQNVGYTDATIGCSLKQPKSIIYILTNVIGRRNWSLPRSSLPQEDTNYYYHYQQTTSNNQANCTNEEKGTFHCFRIDIRN